MISGYKDEDPLPKHQKALPLTVFKLLHRNRFSRLTSAIGDLTTMVLFFAMRSCEYLTVDMKKDESRKTKRIRIRNIRFFIDRRQIPNTSPQIHNATSVSITFEFQKNRLNFITITMHRASGELCPCK